MAWQDAKGVKIVTKNFGVPDSHRLATYRSRGGWEAFRKAPRRRRPRWSTRSRSPTCAGAAAPASRPG